MEKKEFYGQKEIPEEDIERLKVIEYPNFVSETLLSELNLSDKKVVDVGAGPNARLAEYVTRRNGVYVPVDLRIDVLKEMRRQLDITTPFNLSKKRKESQFHSYLLMLLRLS